MEHIKTFLDTSTVHGLSRISGTRKLSRLFWILVVISGFIGSVYLIHISFYNWEKSPISTTTETLPISQITFPNVTVCPPRNSFLNLNYDIMLSQNKTLDNKARKELFDYSLDVINDEFYEEIMANLSKVEDPDRFYNWYHGYATVEYPFYIKEDNQLNYMMYTSATSGNISTQYFGNKFEADKVDGRILIKIYVSVPPSLIGDTNVTLMLEITKRTMKEVSDNDLMTFDCSDCTTINIDADLRKWTKNITAPNPEYGYYFIKLDRKVSQDDIKNIDLDMMPGFRFTWNYTRVVDPKSIYSNQDKNKQFVRCSYLIYMISIFSSVLYLSFLRYFHFESLSSLSPISFQSFSKLFTISLKSFSIFFLISF